MLLVARFPIYAVQPVKLTLCKERNDTKSTHGPLAYLPLYDRLSGVRT